MNSKILLIFIIVTFVVISGCTEPTPEKVREIPQVQQFYADNPGAKYTQQKIPANLMNQIITSRTDCALKQQDYWRVKLEGEFETLEIWLETSLLTPECIYKETTKDPPIIENPDNLCETDSECADDNPVTLDSCDRTTFTCKNELLSCANLGGKVCNITTECTESTVATSDVTTCCLTACRPLDLCSGVSCLSNQKCVNGSCTDKTCFEISGTICSEGKICSGEYKVSGDTTNCCIGSCIEKSTCDGVVCSFGQSCIEGACQDKAINAKECGGYVEGVTTEQTSTDCFCEAYSTCNLAKLDVIDSDGKEYDFTTIGKNSGTCNVRITGISSSSNLYWQPNDRTTTCADPNIITSKQTRTNCIERVIDKILENAKNPNTNICSGDLIDYQERSCQSVCENGGWRWGKCATTSESLSSPGQDTYAGEIASCKDEDKDYCVCYDNEGDLGSKIDIGNILDMAKGIDRLYFVTDKGIYKTVNGSEFIRDLVPESNETYQAVAGNSDVIYAISTNGLYINRKNQEWKFVPEIVLVEAGNTNETTPGNLKFFISNDVNSFIVMNENPSKLYYIKNDLQWSLADENELYSTATSITIAFGKIYIGQQDGSIYSLNQETSKLTEVRETDDSGIDNSILTVYGTGVILVAGMNDRTEYSENLGSWRSATVNRPVETISPGIKDKTGKVWTISDFLGSFYAGAENGLFKSIDGKRWSQVLSKGAISPNNLSSKIPNFEVFDSGFYMANEDALWVTSNGEDWSKITE